MHGQKLFGALAVALGVLALGCGGNQEGPVEDHTKPGRICELHHMPYAEEVIPIHYFGKPATPKWTEAQKSG